MDFHHQLTVIHHSISSQIENSTNLSFISAEKWRALMLKILTKLRQKEFYDTNLIDDISTVVQKLSQDRFLQAIMRIEPFKPNFMKKSRRSFSKYTSEESSSHKENDRSCPYESKRLQLSSIIKFKREIHSKVRDSIFELQQQNKGRSTLLEQTLSLITEQETLSKQFESLYHPFRLIMDQFLFLLQHKFKNYIDSNQDDNIQHIQQMILYDINLLQEFIIKASVPYLKIFKSKNKHQKIEFQIQLVAFIKKYLEKHARINALIKKILKYAFKKSKNLAKLEKNIPNFMEIGMFNIEQKFRINGEYLFSINTLIELSQSTSPVKSLRKLQELRGNIFKDIDDYYQRSNATQASQLTRIDEQREKPLGINLKISVESQLEILKFVLCKIKIYLIDVLTELKYLQTVLGENDISYKYDDSSFMYAQLMVAVEILVQQFI